MSRVIGFGAYLAGAPRRYTPDTWSTRIGWLGLGIVCMGIWLDGGLQTRWGLIGGPTLLSLLLLVGGLIGWRWHRKRGQP